MADPVPEAAVEAAASVLASNLDGRCGRCGGSGVHPRSGKECGGCDATGWGSRSAEEQGRDAACEALSAAFDPGTVIAVPQDEQGQRELVERAARAISAQKAGAYFWGLMKPAEQEKFYRQAASVLQALDLLPEQEDQ